LSVRRVVSLSILALVASAPAGAAPPDGSTLFEKSVRPVLVGQCVNCHGPEKKKGGLRLDTRAGLLEGGDRGPAIDPAKPGDSLLLRVLYHDGDVKMPPKNKLRAAEIAAVREWLTLGAPWPDSADVRPAPKPAAERAITAADRDYWAFRPVRRPDVPRNGPTHPIDAFLSAPLTAAGLAFAVPADRRTLIRRVTFDLTGLPPSPGEVEAFVADADPQSYDRLVDRLLASPAYGEKWGRRWLDVVRYADSNGMDENLAYVNAWRYRDWVIKSLNADVPYDRFVREQIAGDLIPGGPGEPDAERHDRIVATGIHVFGPKMIAEDDPVKMRMDIVDEQLDTVGQAFLGLTFGCARCHDHKFDPISAADYYGLAGMFASTKTMQNFKVVAVWNERPLGTPEAKAAVAAFDAKLTKLQSEVKAAQKPVNAGLFGSAAATARLNRLRADVAAHEKARPAVPLAMAVEDDKGEDLAVHLRGNHLTLGPVVPRRFPRVLAGDRPLGLGADRSGRKELADWMASPEHPLTARVMVNRLWAGHFGAGLVRSTDNFGRLGDRPSHPELLDWLAAEFVARGWSMKAMHKLMVTSAAYRQSSVPSPKALATDPDNRLLSHARVRRLDAEEIRDGMLATAGLLDRTAGGQLLKATPRQYVNSTASKNYDGYAIPRRSVYLPVIRSGLFDVFQTLDFPDPSVPNGQRTATTIPTQALFMLNSSIADQTAGVLAKTVRAAASDDDGRVREAFRRVYARPPTAAERTRVFAFLNAEADAADAALSSDEREQLSWRGVGRVLLASNEFVFVD
jgi:mono/diheme cytochrome c family protein